VLVAVVVVETFSMALNYRFTTVTVACLNSRFMTNLFAHGEAFIKNYNKKYI
jgi:hypothetical protein